MFAVFNIMILIRMCLSFSQRSEPVIQSRRDIGSSVVSSDFPALNIMAKTITTENRNRICNILSVRIFYDSKFKLFKSCLPIASSRLGAMGHKWRCGTSEQRLVIKEARALAISFYGNNLGR